MKVGEVAKATGVTVRTLHHYEEIGLLKPSSRSGGGHREYSEADIQTLQQIVSLKQLGFRLEDIHDCLVQKRLSPLEIIRLHQKRVLQERDQLGKLFDRLEMLEQSLAAGRDPSVQELLTTIEVMQMYDKYFSQEQLAELKARRENIGEQKMQEYQEAWAALMEKVKAEAEKQTDPASPFVQQLASEWDTLIKAFTGGNSAIEARLSSMHRNEPALREKIGTTPEVYEYVGKMMSHFRQKASF